MTSHQNRKQRPALHREFGVRIPVDGSQTEIDEAYFMSDAMENAILPWRWAEIDAKNAVGDLHRQQDDAVRAVEMARAALAAAEQALITVRADVATRLPAAQETASTAAHYYRLARSAVLDAAGERRRWRISRNGRVVTVDGTLDISRADHCVRVTLGAAPAR